MTEVYKSVEDRIETLEQQMVSCVEQCNAKLHSIQEQAGRISAENKERFIEGIKEIKKPIEEMTDICTKQVVKEIEARIDNLLKHLSSRPASERIRNLASNLLATLVMICAILLVINGIGWSIKFLVQLFY